MWSNGYASETIYSGGGAVDDSGNYELSVSHQKDIDSALGSYYPKAAAAVAAEVRAEARAEAEAAARAEANEFYGPTWGPTLRPRRPLIPLW